MSNRNDNDPLAGIQSYQEMSGQTGDQPPPPPPGGSRQQAMAPRSPLLTGLVLGLLLVVVSIGLFQLLGSDDGAETAAPTETTVGGDGDTTEGTSSTDATSGTTDPTSEGTGGEDDTVLPGDESAYVAVGDPIPVSELPLAVDGVGPIKFGEPADQAVGRLIASLGDPNEDTGAQPSVGEWGVCEGDTERIVLWGPFAAIVVVDSDGTETFAGYRLDFALGGFSSEAADLATLSGLQAGSSLRQLEQIYAEFDVRTAEDADLGTIWELKSVNTGALLLWGPLTTDDTVRGIYAPDACTRF